jgi:hypothetical protein
MDMAQCKACGSENPVDVRYCGRCGKPLAAEAAAAADNTASAPPWYRHVGFALTGIVLAGVVGYLVGSRLDNRPAGESVKPGAEAAARPAGKAVRTAHAETPGAEGATSAPAAGEAHWAKMRAELADCSRFNIICQEKVRWRYCSGFWGKVAECPQASSK